MSEFEKIRIEVRKTCLIEAIKVVQEQGEFGDVQGRIIKTAKFFEKFILKNSL